MKKAYHVRLDEDVIDKIKNHTEKYTTYIRETVNLRVDPKRERMYFFKKYDGQCYYCDKAVGQDFEVDHVIPTVMGGTSKEWNLVLSCRKCNREKSDFHCLDNEEILERKSMKYFNSDIDSLNDGYFEVSVVERIILAELLKRKHEVTSLLTFSKYSKTHNASEIFNSCYMNNIKPVKVIAGHKCIHLFVLIEYCMSVLGSYRYLVYEEIVNREIFKENSKVFSKLKLLSKR